MADGPLCQNRSRTLNAAAATPPAARLSSIQALRGIAAVLVVLSHAARHVDKAFGAPRLITLFQSGHAGVDLFFTISGFIILFVHRRDIGRPDRLKHYLGRRFTRVMPLYWVALLLTVGMNAAGSHGLPSALDLVWSASLLPSFDAPIVAIAWTLQYEVVFYVVFAILICSRQLGTGLMLAWLAWSAATASGFASSHIPPALCGIYCVEFLIGMAAARMVAEARLRRPLTIALTGLLLFATVMVLESLGLVDGYADPARLAYGPAAALLIAGLATAEAAGRVNVPAWLERVGGASYSIYLFQFGFIGPVWQAALKLGLDKPGDQILCFVVLSLAAILGGVAMSRLVERPLLSLMRPRQRTSVPAPAE